MHELLNFVMKYVMFGVGMPACLYQFTQIKGQLQCLNDMTETSKSIPLHISRNMETSIKSISLSYPTICHVYFICMIENGTSCQIFYYEYLIIVLQALLCIHD